MSVGVLFQGEGVGELLAALRTLVLRFLIWLLLLLLLLLLLEMNGRCTKPGAEEFAGIHCVSHSFKLDPVISALIGSQCSFVVVLFAHREIKIKLFIFCFNAGSAGSAFSVKAAKRDLFRSRLLYLLTVHC